MLRPFIVGLGRSGAGLHLKALKDLAAGAASGEEAPFSRPPLAWDPRPEAGHGLTGLTVAASLAAAARLTEPDRAVVHLCTPPEARAGVLEELAVSGFTRFLVEKPLACDPAQLDQLVRLREKYRLHMTAVAHWLAAELTRRLHRLVTDRTLGTLLGIEVAQHKPRFTRTLATEGHPTAFDVEVPHSLGVVLHLAGSAELVTAHCTDMVCDGTVVPHMGRAALTLRHHSGVRTEIVSDLASPVRQRTFTLRFTHGTATAHYPISEQDHHAQLILTGAVESHDVFHDEALTAFLRQTYERFAAGGVTDFAHHHAVARLLCEAKAHCRADDGPAPSRGPR
ncbi:hypothetical protein [Streptomyces albus]|uniref:hypothetical protein n=1 Tax=Streptomyces albus TaxID=1888 RepID=UPI0033FF8445